MKEETYKLNDAGNAIVQQPEMKEPEHYAITGFFTIDDRRRYFTEMCKYKEHIASLKTYPISGTVPESWKGKELVEGRDFKLQRQKLGERYGNFFDAVPIQQPKEESQQDETQIQLLHSLEYSLEKANKLDFDERIKAKQKILEIVSIQRININKNDIE